MTTSVLIVDDDRFHANALRAQLRSLGLDSVHELTGAEGIDYVFGHRPRVLFVAADLGSGLDGPATAASIHGHRDVPVIFLVRRETPDHLRELLARHDAVVLPKPCSRDHLVAALQRACPALLQTPVPAVAEPRLADAGHAARDATASN